MMNYKQLYILTGCCHHHTPDAIGNCAPFMPEGQLRRALRKTTTSKRTCPRNDHIKPESAAGFYLRGNRI